MRPEPSQLDARSIFPLKNPEEAFPSRKESAHSLLACADELRTGSKGS